MTQDQAKALLAKAAGELGEHFEAVQILATWRDETTTYARHEGQGNYYARVQLAQTFVDEDRAKTFAYHMPRMGD